MSIAIIGGGIFGAVTAIRLAEMGEKVTLFERLPGLLQGASGNANRLHLGFHYPRDDETARQCVRGYRRFLEDFQPAILDQVKNAYFIATEGSLTSSANFLSFCDRIGLPYTLVNPAEFEPVVQNVQMGILTDEVVFDPSILRTLLTQRMERAGVSLQLGSAVTDVVRAEKKGFTVQIGNTWKGTFDSIVNCSYPEINRLTARLGHVVDTLQFEYTAVAIIEFDVPDPLSITVLDGPFMTLLPFGAKGEHLLLHVDHSVVAREDVSLLNPSWLDPHRSPFAALERDTWFRELLEKCGEFVPALHGARLKRVLEGPRMVLAGAESTDARPSIVRTYEPGYITVLAGKVDHCMWVADEVAHALHVEG